MCRVAVSGLAGLLLTLGAQMAPAQAQMARTFVSSVNGNDANDCGRLTPCRTFQAAHDKTFPDGEITVLDPGGYGAVTIGKSISIVNDGVGEAGVLVSGGAVGIEVAAANAFVNLRGITVQGIGFGGGTGLRLDNAFALTLTNCVIRNHTGNGIDYRPNFGGSLAVSNSLVADNGGSGISVQPFGANPVTVTLTRVEMYNNSHDGFTINTQSATGAINGTVTDSVAANNFQAGFATRGASPGGATVGAVLVTRSVSSNNRFGFLTENGSAQDFVVGESVVTLNALGAASPSVRTYGDNYSYLNSGTNDLVPTHVFEQKQ